MREKLKQATQKQQQKALSKDVEAALKQQKSKRQQQQQQHHMSSNGQVNEKQSSKSIMLAQAGAAAAAAANHLAAPSSNNNNNNNNNQKELLQQDKKDNNNNMMNFCRKGKWILLASMLVTLFMTAVLVAVLTVSYLDNEDQCFHFNYQIQQPTYNLFSTKTTYSTTIQHLNQSSPSFSSSVVSRSSLFNDKNSQDDLPPIFSKSDSLKTLHDKLVLTRQCKVRQLHYIGRHAARFPSTKGINNINQLINKVQARIDLSKFTPPNTTSQQQQQQQQQQNNNNNGNTNTNNSNKSSVCYNPFAQYKQWTTFMVAEQGNLIMDTGAEETQAIAQRFKAIYPEMFDAKVAKIEFGTTEELRTAQTALVFLKQLDNFALDFCSLEQFPTENLSSATRAEELDRNECYKQFLKTYHKDKLQFHKKCEAMYKDSQYPNPYNLNVKAPNRTEFIAASLSKKLRLSKENYLTTDEADAIYKICKFETALAGSSIWCNLFSNNDLKFYEFLNDIDDFFNQAYGTPEQARSSCPVTTELIKSFKAAKAQPSTTSSPSSSASRSQPEAHFYFTHSEVIQKILAASVDLEHDPEYLPSNIKKHLEKGTTPDKRSWRTSLFTPFSANIAFTLYDCPLQAAAVAQQGSGGNFMDVDVSESHLKVVASLNEQPILLEGCANHVCDLNEILSDSRINREKKCKLEEICWKNIVTN